MSVWRANSRQHLGLVHAGADGPHHALLPQLVEGGVGAVQHLAVVLVGIVHEHDVDPVEAHPLEARLERAQHALAAVVAPPARRGRDGEALVVLAGAGGIGLEQPPDLGRDDERVARALAQDRADAALRQAQPVVRGRVEVADAGVPRALDGAAGVLVRRHPIQVADRRAAERQARQLHPAAADGAASRNGAHSSHTTGRPASEPSAP